MVKETYLEESFDLRNNPNKAIVKKKKKKKNPDGEPNLERGLKEKSKRNGKEERGFGTLLPGKEMD